MWRLGDQLREYRGDSHTMAWIAAGFDATEIGLLTELYWGLPMRSYSRTRAWTDAEFDAATDRLRARGLIDDDGFTAAGRDAARRSRSTTDDQMRPALDALGDDVDGAVLDPRTVGSRDPRRRRLPRLRAARPRERRG